MIDVADIPGDSVAVNVVVEKVNVVVDVCVPNVRPDAVPGIRPVIGSGVGVINGK
jgi:hypothetical protein